MFDTSPADQGRQRSDIVPGRFQVLIVDDEPIQRLVLSRCAETVGGDADTASSVTDAAGLLSLRHYDVVVLDLCLGDQDGILLLEQLTKGPNSPSVIFVSGVDDRVRAAAVRIAGNLGLRVAGTLAKPVDFNAFKALLLCNPLHIENGLEPTVIELMENSLERALEENQIFVEFQPKVDLASGKLIGAEALARWYGPTGARISPDQFIPLAEKSGLIRQLTRRVLYDSIAACIEWRKVCPGCTVAVNLSPQVLSDKSLLDEIDLALKAQGLPTDALIVEVTESSIIGNLEVATELLTRLSIKGIRVSMDDFGTGYSSLLSLMTLPFTELKIDRSFVRVCQTELEAWKIIRATISLAHELGILVVAEGIESPGVGEKLRRAGCDVGQGWIFGYPLAADLILESFAVQGSTTRRLNEKQANLALYSDRV